MLVHPGVLPLYLTCFTIQAKQFACISHNHQSCRIVCHGCYPIVLLNLVFTISHPELSCLLGLGVIVEDTFLIELNPIVFVMVNIDSLNGIAAWKKFLHDAGHIALELLRHRIVHTVVHSLLQPQTTLGILHNLVGIVVAHRRCIAHTREESLHTIAVITVQTIGGSYPDITMTIAKHAVHLRVRQSVARVQPAELYIRNGCLYDD